MEQVRGLVETLLAHAKVRFVPPADPSVLEQRLSRAWEEARTRWPGVELSAPLFVAHVASRLPEAQPDSPLEPLVEELSLSELYLACACVHGIPSAIESFDRHYLAKLPAMLRGPGQSAELIEDVCQQARLKLLVPTPDGEPRLAAYTGRGALLSWVRVTASRMKLRLRDAQTPPPERDADELLGMLPGQGLDPELDLIRRRHHADFRLALREAFATLPDDKRHLLRLYFADRLSSYELAPLFRVNQATISRWLKAARQAVYEETRRRLQERLGLSTRDFESIVAGLDSQLELSLSQLLGGKDGLPRPPGSD
ncbi:sigma-70 family RNA polymerase sigma factor [Pyxidicoccus sp. 3LG]